MLNLNTHLTVANLSVVVRNGNQDVEEGATLGIRIRWSILEINVVWKSPMNVCITHSNLLQTNCM